MAVKERKKNVDWQMSSKRNLQSSIIMKAIYGMYPVLPNPRKNVAKGYY